MAVKYVREIIGDVVRFGRRSRTSFGNRQSAIGIPRLPFGIRHSAFGIRQCVRVGRFMNRPYGSTPPHTPTYPPHPHIPTPPHLHTLFGIRHSALGILLLLTGCQTDLPSRAVADAYRELPEQVDFNFDVRPILSDRCYPCHGPDENTREADLRLDTPEGAFAVLPETGNRAIVADSIEKSTLIDRIFHDDPEERMPPAESKMSLSPAEQATLVKWIEQGAEWKPHWAFIAPERPHLPKTNNANWQRNDIDAFILSRLESEGLDPSPEAKKETLLRRVTLDLTGLPPTLEEMDDFLADTNSDAYERAVDRLLGSPAYGERWAWDWLDAARYADTNGFQGDPTRTMWPWRDWVVDAINTNMPFDQFTIEQLAGDLLPDATNDQILATAFNRNHMYNGEGGRIPEETRVENVFDRVETAGTVWMGLTTQCSRCHDHKFDPLTQREYYQLYDYFNQTSEEGGQYTGKVAPVLDLSPVDYQEQIDFRKAALDEIAERVAQFELAFFPREEGKTAADSPKAAGLIGENVDALRLHPGKRTGYYLRLLYEAYETSEPTYAALLKKLRRAEADFTSQASKNLLVMVMDEREEPRETFILARGTYNKPTGEQITVALPAFLPPMPAESPNNRLGLAEWLVTDEHPLTARVTVNRFWQAFFGTGLVKTAEDFGVQSEKPSHPRLLDWLAVEFRESGWDVKALHRLIVTSATYRQDSRVTPELLERDPENRLLARGVRRRLPSWMMRDQALAVSGLMVDEMGGPSVKPYQPAGIWEEATFGKTRYEQDHGDALYRRTLYTFWRRIVGPTMLFDNSSRQTCSVSAPLTNTPLHALTTLNDITYVEAARVMAERVMKMNSEDEKRIATAFRLATARYPDEREQSILSNRLAELKTQYRQDSASAEALLAVGEAERDTSLDAAEHAAYTGLASLILNLDEAITKQ